MSKKVNFNFRSDDGSMLPSNALSYSDYLALSYGLLAENGQMINVGGQWEVAHYIDPMSYSEYENYLEKMSVIESQTKSDLCDNRGKVDFSNFFPASAIKGRKKYVAPRMHVYNCNLDILANIPRAFERLAYMQTLDVEALDAWSEDIKRLIRFSHNLNGLENPKNTLYLLNLVIYSRFGM